MNYIPYQIVYKEIPKITIKKKMMKENNERIKERQIQRKDEREHSILNY